MAVCSLANYIDAYRKDSLMFVLSPKATIEFYYLLFLVQSMIRGKRDQIQRVNIVIHDVPGRTFYKAHVCVLGGEVRNLPYIPYIFRYLNFLHTS